MDRGAWRATVHGITKRGTRLSDQHQQEGLLEGGGVPRGLASVTNLPPQVVKAGETWVGNLVKNIQ